MANKTLFVVIGERHKPQISNQIARGIILSKSFLVTYFFNNFLIFLFLYSSLLSLASSFFFNLGVFLVLFIFFTFLRKFIFKFSHNTCRSCIFCSTRFYLITMIVLIFLHFNYSHFLLHFFYRS